MTLQEFFAAAPKAAVAGSGGPASAVVRWAARDDGGQVRA